MGFDDIVITFVVTLSKIIAKTHLILKKKFKNLLTIIIPRHTQRINEINDEMINLN